MKTRLDVTKLLPLYVEWADSAESGSEATMFTDAVCGFLLNKQGIDPFKVDSEDFIALEAAIIKHYEAKRRQAAYPNISDIVLTMAAAHGMLHRWAGKAKLLEAAFAALEADGVVTEDVRALEQWLAPLDADQRSVLADGEETEMQDLIDASPLRQGSTEVHVASLFADAYEAMLEVQ